MGIAAFPQTAEKKWKFWCHEIIDLFLEDPFENFWHVG